MNEFDKINAERVVIARNALHIWALFCQSSSQLIDSYNRLEEAQQFPASMSPEHPENSFVVTCTFGMTRTLGHLLAVKVGVSLERSEYVIEAVIERRIMAPNSPPQRDGQLAIFRFVLRTALHQTDSGSFLGLNDIWLECDQFTGQRFTPDEAADKVLRKALWNRGNGQEVFKP